MIYDSLDTIPCKIFFKVMESQDFTLLSKDKKVPAKELEAVWEKLEKEHREIVQLKEDTRIANLYKVITTLEAKRALILVSLDCLHHKKDPDIIQLVEKLGYKIDVGNYFESLVKVKNKVTGLTAKINRMKMRLPKKPKKKISLDESIYGYAGLAEISIADTNTVTMSQYYAIKNLGERRLKSMKNGGK